MLGLRFPPATVASSLVLTYTSRRLNGSSVRCALKGPRPRYPRVWKSRKRIGTISKAAKLIECIKGLSNVKEEGMKKALKTLENEEEWRRVIQVTKWMLSKGQGKTKGSYYTLLNALAEDGRLEEAEELWTMIFSESLEHLPRGLPPVTFGENGQPIGDNSVRLSSKIGEVVRTYVSPIYLKRSDVPNELKELVLEIVSHSFEVPEYSKRKGQARVAAELSQQNPNGLVTRTQVYLATHGRKDGATGNQYLDEIDNLIQRDPTIVEKDLNHDPVALALGRDNRGLELKGFRRNIKGSCFIANCICLSVVEVFADVEELGIKRVVEYFNRRIKLE
ncbi:hypothetical protein AAC387_Pa11g0764 [Persea americana]